MADEAKARALIKHWTGKEPGKLLESKPKLISFELDMPYQKVGRALVEVHDYPEDDEPSFAVWQVDDGKQVKIAKGSGGKTIISLIET